MQSMPGLLGVAGMPYHRAGYPMQPSTSAETGPPGLPSLSQMPSSSGGPALSQIPMAQLPKLPPHPSSTPKSSKPPDMLQLHLAGKCYPCVAYALKPAGCFKGEACMHCHFCNAKEAKARRRELQQAARRRKRMENALLKDSDCVAGEDQQSPQEQPKESLNEFPKTPEQNQDIHQLIGSTGKQSFWL